MLALKLNCVTETSFLFETKFLIYFTRTTSRGHVHVYVYELTYGKSMVLDSMVEASPIHIFFGVGFDALILKYGWVYASTAGVKAKVKHGVRNSLRGSTACRHAPAGGLTGQTRCRFHNEQRVIRFVTCATSHFQGLAGPCEVPVQAFENARAIAVACIRTRPLYFSPSYCHW